jgi:hypothetical protein
VILLFDQSIDLCFPDSDGLRLHAQRHCAHCRRNHSCPGKFQLSQQAVLIHNIFNRCFFFDLVNFINLNKQHFYSIIELFKFWNHVGNTNVSLLCKSENGIKARKKIKAFKF